MPRNWLGAAAVVATTCIATCIAAQAQAQTYPNKPIRMIVAIAAGSVTDVIMRAAATELAPRLGQQLVIENKGGAAGILGAQACASAAGDGYTLCVIYHSTTSYNPLLFEKLPYDADTDFVPVSRLFFLTEGLFVNSALPANSVAELKALAAAKRTALNYGTLGDGSFPDLFMRWLNNQWGSGIVGVPYRGGGPIAQAVAAGDIQMSRVGVGNFRALDEAGKVKTLAVSAAKRTPLMPKVPTFAEAGLGGYPGQGWWGLAVPKGTPPAIVTRLNAEFVRLFREPKFVEFLDSQAVESSPTTPEEFAEFIKQDRKAAETLIKIANTPRTEYKPEP
jgi:tripartite-type tricarboxylate transporter receptor subunit TctC